MRKFDIGSLPISTESRNQLKQIYRSVLKGGKALERRSGLLRLLLNVDQPDKGCYIPLANDVHLWRKKPTDWDVPPEPPSQFFERKKPAFFTNGLSLFGAPGCPSGEDLKPRNRVANVGFLIVTMECDPESHEGLDEQLAWVRGVDGDLKKSRIAGVDRSLCRFKDYVGCCIVFSGNKSVHCHFLFRTDHLQPAPEPHGTRWDKSDVVIHSAYMTNVHGRYWDAVCDRFCAELNPSVPPDRKLRSATQWRRFPWGERNGSSAALQLVVWENLRARAPRGAEAYLIPPDFTSEAGRQRNKQKHNTPSNLSIDPDVIGLMQEECSIEWGTSYPRPVRIEYRQDGAWIFFQNDEEDRNPSTFVGGEVRKLQICGRSHFDREFFLPDGMSANEFVEFCMRRCGIIGGPMNEPKSVGEGVNPFPELTDFAALKARDERGSVF